MTSPLEAHFIQHASLEIRVQHHTRTWINLEDISPQKLKSHFEKARKSSNSISLPPRALIV